MTEEIEGFKSYDDKEEAIKSLPESMQALAKEFPPGSHFHMFIGDVYLWGYAENGTDLMLSFVRPTTESISLDTRAHVFPVPAQLFRSGGVRPCHNSAKDKVLDGGWVTDGNVPRRPVKI